MKLTTPVSKWSQCGGHAETPRALATEQCWEWLASPQKSAFNTKKTTNSVFQRAAIFLHYNLYYRLQKNKKEFHKIALLFLSCYFILQ
jgi:hypothetical protein